MSAVLDNVEAIGQTEVVVRVMDKPFTITCPNDKVQALQNSAAHLDAEMRKIRQAGKIVGSDQIAILAGLNIAYELLTGQDSSQVMSSNLTDKLTSIEHSLAAALAKEAE